MKYPYRKFVPLRTIDFVKIGLGDNLMAWAGLFALLKYGYRICSSDCKMYVPKVLTKLASQIFQEWSIQVEGADFNDIIEYRSPVLTPLAPNTVRQSIDVYMGDDWRLNWAEAIDRIKTDSYYHQKPTTLKQKIRLQISETLLHGRIDWRSAYPDYIGSRIWSPIARRHNIPQTKYLVMLKNTLGSLRECVQKYAANINVASDYHSLVFPVGKSYQTLPPEFCHKLSSAIPDAGLTYIIPPNDPWREGYFSQDLKTDQLESIDEILGVLQRAKYVVTTDSFVSHAMQFLRDDFVLVLSRDFHENVVHPGAYPQIVAKHPDCAPCEYHSREFYKNCPAGFRYCIAFEDASFLDRCAYEIRTLLSKER